MLHYKLGVVGAGRIGSCEATLMAGHGCEVVVVGVSESDLARCRGLVERNFDELIKENLATEANKQAAISRVTVTTDYNALAGCSFVLEAALEQAELKRAIYKRVEAICGADTLLASTTSAISAENLAAELVRPENFVIAHPFQPAHMLPLVELVGGPKTAPESIARVKKLLEELGREVVVLRKSVSGFLINRFAQALFREAIYLIEAGVADAADIDKAVKYAVGMRYASIGLLEYFDDVGFQLESEIAESVYGDLCGTQKVQQTVRDGLASGLNGRGAGKGFYDWADKDEADYLRRKAAPYLKCFHWDMPTEPIEKEK